MPQPYAPHLKLSTWAYALAQEEMEKTLPRRWSHVKGYTEFAREIARYFVPDDDLLVACGALAAVGFAPQHAKLGYGPVDSAHLLQSLQVPIRAIALAINYDAVAIEAEVRGFSAYLAAFPDERSVVRDAVWYCDLRVGPDGQRMTLEERLAEIAIRYGDDPPMAQYLVRARDELYGAVERTEAHLAAWREQHA